MLFQAHDQALKKHKPKLLSPDILSWGKGLSHEGGEASRILLVKFLSMWAVFWG